MTVQGRIGPRRKRDWKPWVIIKKGMLLRAKGNIHPLSVAVTDEYTDEERWQNQVKYWLPHKLKGRPTLVDVTHVRFRRGVIIPDGKKVYTYPREQESPLSKYEINRLLHREPAKRLNEMNWDELTKQAKEALAPFLNDTSDKGVMKKVALAVWRAYDQGHLKVPIMQVSDSELLMIRNFGPKSLERLRTIIPRSSV